MRLEVRDDVRRAVGGLEARLAAVEASLVTAPSLAREKGDEAAQLAQLRSEVVQLTAQNAELSAQLGWQRAGGAESSATRPATLGASEATEEDGAFTEALLPAWARQRVAASPEVRSRAAAVRTLEPPTRCEVRGVAPSAAPPSILTTTTAKGKSAAHRAHAAGTVVV